VKTSPLARAAERGHVECVRVLLRGGAEIDEMSGESGATAIAAAAGKFRSKSVK
jgi:hypothetical protein